MSGVHNNGSFDGWMRRMERQVSFLERRGLPAGVAASTGLIAYGYAEGNATYTTSIGLFWIQFYAQEGHAYRVNFSGIAGTIATANAPTAFSVLLCNPPVFGDEAPDPDWANTSEPMTSWAHSASAGGNVSWNSASRLLRAPIGGLVDPEGNPVDGELMPGTVKLMLAVTTTGSMHTVAWQRVALSVEGAGVFIDSTAVASPVTP